MRRLKNNVCWTPSPLSASKLVLNIVHKREGGGYGADIALDGIARLATQETCEFSRRLYMFVQAFHNVVGRSLVTFSRQFGMMVNIFADGKGWESHVLRTLFELSRLMPGNTVEVLVPLGDPNVGLRVMNLVSSVPDNLNLQIVIHDPSGQVPRFENHIGITKIEDTPIRLETPKFDNLSPVVTAQGFSPIIWAWSKDLEAVNMRVLSAGEVSSLMPGCGVRSDTQSAPLEPLELHVTWSSIGQIMLALFTTIVGVYFRSRILMCLGVVPLVSFLFFMMAASVHAKLVWDLNLVSVPRMPDFLGWIARRTRFVRVADPDPGHAGVAGPEFKRVPDEVTPGFLPVGVTIPRPRQVCMVRGVPRRPIVDVVSNQHGFGFPPNINVPRHAMGPASEPSLYSDDGGDDDLWEPASSDEEDYYGRPGGEM